MKRKIDLHRTGKFVVNVWNKEKSGFEQKPVLLEIDYQGLAEHLGWRAWTQKSKQAKFVQGLIKVTQAAVLIAVMIAPVRAYDRDKNPDRFPSIGLDVSSGKLAGIQKDTAAGAPHTDGGFVKGLLDVRLPITNALTVHAFGSSTGVNNNLQFSEGSEVGVGLRIFIQ